MSSRVFIKGTRRFSESRRALSRAIGVQQIRRTNSNYVPREDDVLINWGQYGEDYGNIPKWLNHPCAVRQATSKTDCFAQWERAGVSTVRWTRSVSTAKRWVVQAGVVMHRALNSGSQGRGIVLCYSMDDVMEKLGGFFCQLFGNEDNVEYRIHVVDGEIIDTTQKRRRSRRNGYEGRIDPVIRSWGNGWVFCRENVISPRALNRAALDAVRALGLDFGAVDCAVKPTGEVCIYEVNTAPGIEGTTLAIYAAALTRYVGHIR